MFSSNTRERSTQTTKKRGTRSVRTQTQSLKASTSSHFETKSAVGYLSTSKVQPVDPHKYHGHGHVDTAEPTCEPSKTEVDVESICSCSSEESVTQDDFEESTTASDESSEDDERTVLKAQDQIKLLFLNKLFLMFLVNAVIVILDCVVSIENQIGSSCSSCTAENEHYFEWTTGPSLFKMPAFHLLLASGILVTGMESAKVLRLFNVLNIPNVKRQQLSKILKNYVVTAVYKVWQVEQSARLREIEDEPTIIVSDMRVDSRGHSGLFGSGSTLEMKRNAILDTQVIKSTEVKNSNAMELEFLKRQLKCLEDNKVQVAKLVTDPHIQVSSYMANEKPDIGHSYDIWHVAKGEKKKLIKVTKKKKFRSIKPWIGSIVNHIYWVGDLSSTEDERKEKWHSILNHIVNIHKHDGHKIFVECLHGTLEREWLKQGSASYKKLEEMLTRPRLITAIRKLSQYHQTSGLEAKHSLDNQFASKNTYHSYHSAFKGEKAVEKPVKEKPTYGYIQLIFDEVLTLRSQFQTMKKAKVHANVVLPAEPQSLVEQYLEGKERPLKEQVVFQQKIPLQYTSPTYKQR
ncbi:Hypothetical predicted protein [Paramuricea clavata]|uniref:Uncharacterized protein n=1 Tax=Paramuricea clavata TaxID=317549 RepID=A0A7D9L1S1_PARCT|nr:Hypothetical predicted protein [Paramuricea clavata]